MRHQLLAAILVPALLLLATPALAQTGFYLGAFAGAQYLEDSALRSNQGNREVIKFDWGSHAGVALGYKTGRYFSKHDNLTGRIELELATRRNDADVVAGEIFRPVGGEMKATSLMANTWVDIHTTTPFVPFFGIGLGAARVIFDKVGFADDSDTQFAYQIGGGVGLPLGRHLNIDLGYRYFATLDPTFTLPNGQRYDVDYATHNVSVGLRLGF